MSSEAYEIVFSFDTTGSMYHCLTEVRSRLRAMIQKLKSKIPGIKISIFCHGDYSDKQKYGYITRHVDFTNDADRLCSFVESVQGTGGKGKAVYELVMREVQEKLTWTNGSHRSLVLIGDTLPHEAYDGQNRRNLDWRYETVRMRDMNVKIYAIQCGCCKTGTDEFFHHISSQTFGYHMTLPDFSQVEKLLLNICFREAGLEHIVLVKPSEAMHVTTQLDKDSLEMLSKTTSTALGLEPEGLICQKCGEGKLSEEFPPTTLTEECDHPPSICLRCIVQYAREQHVCPHESCEQLIDEDNKQLRLFEAILGELFLDYAKVLEDNLRVIHPGIDVLYVSTLTGDMEVIPFDTSLTIKRLKEEVRDRFRIDPKDQILLYNERRLKVKKGSGQLYTLSDFFVVKNSTIYILVPLLRVTEDLDHVVFDLSWGFPETHPDFLDASCFVFQRSEFVQLIDWNHPSDDFYLNNAVVHTQEITTSRGSIGHQKIDLFLKRLPSTITHIFFTLSSWKSPNLSAFSNPSLKFFDARERNRDLCETTFTHALNSPGVIMCSIVRAGKEWLILEYGPEALVDGNAKRYNPIRQKIEELIKESYEM